MFITLLLQSALDDLKRHLSHNGYPRGIISYNMNDVINKHQNKPKDIITVPEKEIFIVLPYLQSWTKVLGQIYICGAFLHVPNKFIYTCSTPPPPPPSYNVGHVFTLFLQSVNIVLGVGGEEATHFKMDNSAFLKFRFKNTGN